MPQGRSRCRFITLRNSLGLSFIFNRCLYGTSNPDVNRKTSESRSVISPVIALPFGLYKGHACAAQAKPELVLPQSECNIYLYLSNLIFFRRSSSSWPPCWLNVTLNYCMSAWRHIALTLDLDTFSIVRCWMCIQAICCTKSKAFDTLQIFLGGDAAGFIDSLEEKRFSYSFWASGEKHDISQMKDDLQRATLLLPFFKTAVLFLIKWPHFQLNLIIYNIIKKHILYTYVHKCMHSKQQTQTGKHTNTHGK